MTAQIKRVDFTNNLEIRRDRLNETVQRIVDFDGDEIEWKADRCDGVTNKNWPVAYPRFTAVALDIDLCVHLEGIEQITGTVRGTTVLAGNTLTFERAGVTLVDGVNHVTGFVARAPSIQRVTFQEPMVITWTIDSDVGRIDAGSSTHNAYITQHPPIGATTIYFSIVHWTTHVGNGAVTDGQLVQYLEWDLKTLRIERRGFDPVFGGDQPSRGGAALLERRADRALARCPVRKRATEHIPVCLDLLR